MLDKIKIEIQAATENYSSLKNILKNLNLTNKFNKEVDIIDSSLSKIYKTECKNLTDAQQYNFLLSIKQTKIMINDILSLYTA